MGLLRVGVLGAVRLSYSKLSTHTSKKLPDGIQTCNLDQGRSCIGLVDLNKEKERRMKCKPIDRQFG
jgi:hypothetical protein